MKGSPIMRAGAECRCETAQVNRAKAAGMSVTGAPVQRRINGLAHWLNTEIAAPRGEAIAIVLFVPLLLLPAIWNRFPIIYYDTGAYLFEGLTGRYIPERAAVYSLLLRFARAGASLWIVAIVQAAMSAFLLAQCARIVTPRMRLPVLLLVGAALVVATSLPWCSGEIEPDCFAALLVLSVYLLAFHARELAWGRGAAVASIGAISVAVHPSHLVLAGFLLVVLVTLRFSRLKPRLGLPVIVCATGLLLVLGGNFYFTRQIFISRAGAPFVFARMLQDGIIMRLLD